MSYPNQNFYWKLEEQKLTKQTRHFFKSRKLKKNSQLSNRRTKLKLIQIENNETNWLNFGPKTEKHFGEENFFFSRASVAHCIRRSRASNESDKWKRQLWTERTQKSHSRPDKYFWPINVNLVEVKFVKHTKRGEIGENRMTKIALAAKLENLSWKGFLGSWRIK